MGAKVAKSLKVEVGINVEGGIFGKKLVHKCNKCAWRVEFFFKINKRASTFIREMRVGIGSLGACCHLEFSIFL